MPTGYTSVIAEGFTFEKFAMTCARAFGAMILMRDESTDAEIPDEFKPSEHHLVKLHAAQARQSALLGMSHPEMEAGVALANQTAQESYKTRRAGKDKLQAQYEAMLVRVQAWTPPTADHEGLKKFMVDQITQSLDFDCGVGCIEDEPQPRLASEWLNDEFAKVNRDIAYYTKAHAEEVERTNDRNNWLKALRASLTPA